MGFKFTRYCTASRWPSPSGSMLKMLRIQKKPHIATQHPDAHVGWSHTHQCMARKSAALWPVIMGAHFVLGMDAFIAIEVVKSLSLLPFVKSMAQLCSFRC